MLTVNHSPTKYFFSRNRNYVEVETDNYTYSVNEGQKSVCYFVNLSNAIVNNTLTLVLGGIPRVYTFKAASNIALLEITTAGAMSPEEHVAELVNVLSADATLVANYRVLGDQNALFFEALAAGTAFSLAGSTTNVSSAGVYVNPGTNDIKIRPRINYKILLTLYGEKSPGVFEKIIEIPKEPFDNKVRADLSKFIDDYLQYDTPYMSVFLPIKCNNTIKRFYLKIQEMYGYPQAIVAASVSPGGIMDNATDTLKYFSLKAGFDEISARMVPDNQQLYYFNNNSFLTRQPRVKKIKPTQNEFLYFLFETGLTDAAVRRTFFFKNGTSIALDATTTGSVLPGVAAKDVWGFPINFSTNLFALSDEIYKMTVALKNTTTNAIISETFTYLKDYDYHQEEIYLYFFNSDGGLDTVRCFGVAEFISDFERETAQRTITALGGDLEASQEVIYTEKLNRATVFSGWVEKAQLSYIEELLLSRKAFLYGNDYGSFDIKIPITVLTKTLKKHKTKENLFGFVIDYREAITSEISQAQYYPII